MYNYIFFLKPDRACSYHIDTLFAYIEQTFPTEIVSMLDQHTIILGDASTYKYLPIKWKATEKKDSTPLINYILEFVNGDINDVFAMSELISEHGWYETQPIS